MIPLFKVLMTREALHLASTTLCSGFVGQGARVEDFERQLRTEFGADCDILTVNSCTSAIDLSLRLCGVGPGDEVVTTPMTCSATNSPIVGLGATPVWSDVFPDTGLIDPASVKARVTPRTKAIIAVDWGGQACDYKALKSLGLPVVEDAAHAFLAACDGGPIAREGGDYVCWSFQAIKHLTTVDGGALKCPGGQVERARLLRWYGLDRRNGDSFRCSQDIAEVGFKYHMNDLAASIGLGNMTEAITGVAKHRDNAQRYIAAFQNNRRALPVRSVGGGSWWIFTLLVDDRRSFTAAMANEGIATSPVHRRNDEHSGFRAASRPEALPGVDAFASREVAIPVGWWLSQDDLRKIEDEVLRWDSETS